jgi:hypothetical protein
VLSVSTGDIQVLVHFLQSELVARLSSTGVTSQMGSSQTRLKYLADREHSLSAAIPQQRDLQKLCYVQEKGEWLFPVEYRNELVYLVLVSHIGQLIQCKHSNASRSLKALRSFLPPGS